MKEKKAIEYLKLIHCIVNDPEAFLGEHYDQLDPKMTEMVGESRRDFIERSMMSYLQFEANSIDMVKSNYTEEELDKVLEQLNDPLAQKKEMVERNLTLSHKTTLEMIYQPYITVVYQSNGCGGCGDCGNH